MTAAVYDQFVATLAKAAETQDPEMMTSLLGDDIIVRSPVTTLIQFQGIDQARELFAHVFSIVSDIRFYDVVGAGDAKQVVFWRGRVGKLYLEEANLLKINDQGKITEMTVFMRALPGLIDFASHIAPALARKHGWWRYAFIRIQLAVMSLIYRSAEPMVVSVSKAGVWQAARNSPL